jgi:AcrR family transcriptional regulator
MRLNLIIQDEKKKTRLPGILKAALKLFVRKGIDGTTTKDIAREAGVAEGALYRHYKSKEELAGSLFIVNLTRFTTELEGKLSLVKGARRKLAVYIAAIFAEYESDPDLFYYLLLAEHKELKEYVREHRHPGHVLEGLIAEGQAEGVFRKVNPYHLVAVALGTVHRMCILRRYGLIKTPLGGASEEISGLVWQALKA